MEILIIAALLFIAAETTYLVALQTKRYAHTRKSPIFVDTSVLIDGRIIAVAESGFITGTLYIPRSVVGELQFLADNADSDKRARARHGLDVVSELQSITRVKVEIFNDGTKADEGVDNRLLKLAKENKGSICTIDFNLNKVAQVENIPVLNVNDLAKSLRMAYLPGEKTHLELTQKGNDQHQAVGHLQDGTMVVVEHSSQYIGKIVEVEFVRGLQTAAGKMMFARVVAPSQPKPQNKQPKGRQQPEPPAKPRQARPQQRPKQPQPNQPRRTQNKRRNNEDSLIELANNQ